MNLPARIIGSVLIALLARSGAGASALDWPVTAQEIKADPKLPTVEAVFAFRNSGARPAVIESATASCDCTQPVLVKTEYAPGETGELRVVFTLGARTGRQEKTVTVTLRDETAEPTVLHLTVDIPESPVRLSAEALVWPLRSPPVEKSVEVILTDPEHAIVEGAQCAEPSFMVRVESATEPNLRKIVVKPVTTDQPLQTTVRLQTRINGQPRIYVVRAQVR